MRETVIEDEQFDVFMSYNSKDRDAVLQLSTALSERGVRVWFDQWRLAYGEPWRAGLEKGLERSQAVAVFIGPGGIGPWEDPEIDVALDQQVGRGARVIPVLLPGAPPKPENLPLFLKRLRAIDLTQGIHTATAVQLLEWGIKGGENPLVPRPLRAPPPGASEALTRGAPAGPTIDDIASALAAGDVTFLLGRTVFGASGAVLPSPSEASARLLKELQLVGDSYDGLVPGVEAVASLLAVAKGELALDQRFADLSVSGPAAPSGAHAALAELVALLARRPPERRARRRAPRLILTTTQDVLMERALLASGTPFTRLVQYRGEPRIDVTTFDKVARTAAGSLLLDGRELAGIDQTAIDDEIYSRARKPVRLGSPEGGNALASLALDGLPEPILYRFHGAHDVPNSSAISADHCLDFAWRLLKQECVPNQISEIIGSSTLLVLGSTVLDNDFRITYHTLLRKPLELSTYPRFAVISRAEADDRDCGLKLTRQAWDAVRQSTLKNYRIEVIDAPVEGFLRQLAARLRTMWGLP
jgi:hypothetical protein